MPINNSTRNAGLRAFLAPCSVLAAPSGGPGPAEPTPLRHAARAGRPRQQTWLQSRLDSVLPRLMRKYGIDMWVIPMREYNEDPVFTALVSPTTFAARRRTIYVFFDRGAGQARCRADRARRQLAGRRLRCGALARSRSSAAVARPPGGALGRPAVAGAQGGHRGAQARGHRRSNMSRTFAFADGLTAGEYEGMRRGAGPHAGPGASSGRRGCRWTSSRPGCRTSSASTTTWPSSPGPSSTRCSRTGHHARRHPHQRPGVVVAPAGQRPGPGHLVPAVGGRAAAGRHRGAARRRSRHPAGRRAPLRLRHHRAAAQHRHPAHGLRAAGGRDGRARRAHAARSRAPTGSRTS